ncbi:MAG: hypothetical protein H7Y07_10145 [Pyrinomonadaceae bacterium]|nr:hypothetical protein [Sphingobacteriaceae bacterium]
MEEEKLIFATNDELIWEQLAHEFKNDPEPLEYHAVLECDERRVLLDICNNHEVGFRAEAFTVFSSYLFNRNSFRFALHKEGFLDEIGKFLGMQDIILGYKDFDDRFIIKTNNEEKTAAILADGTKRSILLELPSLTFGIVEYTLEDSDGKAPFLELKIDAAISDLTRLRSIYSMFCEVIKTVDS